MGKRAQRRLFALLPLAGACLAPAVFPRVAAAQDPSLVGWWRLDETAGTAVSDSSGNGNSGTLAGPFSRVPGQVGNAVSFGGTSRIANDAPASANFPAGTAARTMAAWIRIPARVTSTAMILCHDDFSMQVVAGGVFQAAVTGITRVDDGSWHHVAAVYEGQGGNFRLYVDGQLDQIGTVGDANTKTGGNWRIGQDLGGQESFPGEIDEVRYYGRALSVSEIQAIVTADGGKLGPVPGIFPRDPSLVGWWRLDETDYTAAYDSSGNGNTGTLTGTFSRVPGQMGNAVSFGGTSRISNNAPAPANFPAGAGSRTMAAWIRIPARVTSTAIILYHGDFSMQVVSGGLLQAAITGITRVDDGNWHHVAAVYSGPGGNFSLYVDGQLDQTAVIRDANTMAGGSWRIGQDFAGQLGFPGAIDEVRYYNRALSVFEIQAIVTGDRGKLAPLPVGLSQTVNFKACPPKPGVANMNYGDVASCSIDAAGEYRAFSFQANAGDEVWFNVQRTGGDSAQCYQLTGPDGVAGTPKCVVPDGNGSFSPNLVQEQFLTKTGTYVIQVSGGASTFPFSLGLKREIPLPAQMPQSTFGVAAQGELMTPWDWHYYSLSGTRGDALTINLTRTQTNVGHCLRVYAPSGQALFNLCPAPDAAGNYPATISQNLSLADTGEYVLVVSDSENLHSFDYSLAVNCLGACSNTPLPPLAQICTYSLSPPSELLPAGAAGGVLGVTAPQGCPWSVSSSAGFLTITTSASGGGPDTIGFIVGANTDAASRTSVVSVAGQTSTITQLGTAPLLSATPNPLVFNVQAGSVTKTNTLLSVFSNLASLPYMASTTMNLASALNWLSISSASGSAPSTIAVTVDPSVLPPGTFTGSVTISSPTASPNQIVIPVTANIQSAGAAVLGVSATPIIFSLATGGSGLLVQRTVSNTGAGFLAYTAVVDPANPASWLTVSPSGGSVSVSTPDTLIITASPGSLAAGTYGSDILVSGNGSVVRIPVTMTVGPAGAQILVSQAGLGFTGVAAGGSPSPQTFGILNSGVGSLHWTATATTLSGGNWLQLTPASGTVNRPLLDVSMVTVSVNTSILGPGDYYGKILIAGDALNSGQIVTVLCSVLPSGSDPGPEVRPTGLIFVGTPGQKPPSQPVGVTNRIGQPVSFTSTPLTFDGATWLSQSPVTATVTPNVPGTLSVQSDNTRQVAGVLRGVVTLLFQDGRSSTVNVLNVVAPAGSTPGSSVRDNSPLPHAVACSSPTLQVQFISLQTGFQVALGKAATVSVKVVDNCGSALVPGGGAATPVTASFSNKDPDLQLVSEGVGQWSGTWIPSQMPASGSSVTVTIHAAFVSLGSQQTLQTGTALVIGSLLSSLSPLVSPGRLVDAASSTFAPLAPGELITIFGSNLGTRPVIAQCPPLPTSLAGTSVLLGGVPLPLLYSSAGQINAQVPFELSVNTQHQIVVSNGGALSVPMQITVAAANPGIFSLSGQGTGQGIVFNADQIHLAQPGTPASRGEIIVIYCSGLGQVTPAVADGAAAPLPPATMVNQPTVQIGGATAQILFAGMSPGSTGLYQINAVVPQGAATGNSVPVTVTVSGLTSNMVTMAIQ